MPKKFSQTVKKQWLALSEQNTPAEQIASQYSCDVRTVQRGIDAARHEQDVRAVQREMLKDVLKKHQGDLTRIVHELLYTLVSPQPDAPIKWNREDQPQPITISRATAEYQGGGKWHIVFSVENDLVWDMFLQHVKNIGILRGLNMWKRCGEDHLQARLEFQRRLATLLEEETGLTIESKGVKSIESVATHELYRIALRKVLGYETIDYSEKDIQVGNAGEVMLKGYLLARVGKGKEEQGKNSILTAIEKLVQSPEASAVVATFEALPQAAINAKKELQQIEMMGIVTGKCDICKKLGL